MEYVTLEHWIISGNVFDDLHYINGIVKHKSKTNMSGEYVYDRVFKVEKTDKGYHAIGLKNKYLLFESESADTNVKKQMEKIIGNVWESERKIKSAAEKLLLIGDSLLCGMILCYRSEEGIKIIYPTGDYEGFFFNDSYTYNCPEEKLLIKVYGKKIRVRRKKEYDNRSIYMLNYKFFAIERIDYKYLDKMERELFPIDDFSSDIFS